MWWNSTLHYNLQLQKHLPAKFSWIGYKNGQYFEGNLVLLLVGARLYVLCGLETVLASFGLIRCGADKIRKHDPLQTLSRIQGKLSLLMVANQGKVLRNSSEKKEEDSIYCVAPSTMRTINVYTSEDCSVVLGSGYSDLTHIVLLKMASCDTTSCFLVWSQ